MEIRRFNRHENMSSETRGLILEAIGKLTLCPLGHSTFVVENWLFGSFDGYDYSEYAITSTELASITEVDPTLGAKITEIFMLVNSYPTLILS